MTSKGAALLAILVAALVIVGGAGAFLLTHEKAATGRIVIYVKDAPADWSHVNVTFSVVKIHEANVSEDNDNDNATEQNETTEDDSGWHTLEMEQQTLDLKAFVNISALLADGNVTVGKYTQIRIVVESVTGVLVNGTNVVFKVPSGELKINKPFTIVKDQETKLTVDIDLSKSIVQNPNGWIFKPVLGSIVVG